MEIEVKSWRGVHNITLPLEDKGYGGVVDAKGRQIMTVDAYTREEWLVCPKKIIEALCNKLNVDTTN